MYDVSAVSVPTPSAENVPITGRKKLGGRNDECLHCNIYLLENEVCSDVMIYVYAANETYRSRVITPLNIRGRSPNLFK